MVADNGSRLQRLHLRKFEVLCINLERVWFGPANLYCKWIWMISYAPYRTSMVTLEQKPQLRSSNKEDGTPMCLDRSLSKEEQKTQNKESLEEGKLFFTKWMNKLSTLLDCFFSLHFGGGIVLKHYAWTIQCVIS